MCRYSIRNLLENDVKCENVEVNGWVRTKRESSSMAFLMVNDGSTIENLQVVINLKSLDRKILENVNTGVSVKIVGEIVESKGGGQKIELSLKDLEILGKADNYPIQSKRHTFEFLREVAHLRFRTNTFNAVFRIRNAICFAIHNFFQKNNFVYINTPIITGNDSEGAGEMFTVTTLDLKNNAENDFKNDFFGKKVNLTVSGQLEAEAAIFGFEKVYTFGPTFRAENSNTTRHLAEFWMIEPEMAFCDLKMDIDVAEEFLKYVIKEVLDCCKKELEFLDNRLKKENGKELMKNLENVVEDNFERIEYCDAIEILKKCKKNTNNEFKYKISEWGVDLQSEHERFLTDEYFKKPVVLINFPEKIKAFYMRLNNDNKTVAAMDILFPGIGEIIGGSQREERFDYLEKAMKKRDMNIDCLEWYLDTRKFGSVKHSGFGLGLDRLVEFVTGIVNIRDVVAFPRYPGHADF